MTVFAFAIESNPSEAALCSNRVKATSTSRVIPAVTAIPEPMKTSAAAQITSHAPRTCLP